MEKIIIWLAIMIPVSALITGIGIYALRRKKPMWFYAGTKVKEEEISDVRGVNRANGIMWIAYSGVFWAAAVIGCFSPMVGGIVLCVGAVIGAIVMAVVFEKIWAKYKRG